MIDSKLLDQRVSDETHIALVVAEQVRLMQLQIRKIRQTPSAYLFGLAIVAILPFAMSQSAMAVSPELKPEAEARNTKTELSAGGVHASLEVAKPGLTFSVGGSAFVTLRLANRSKSKSLGAELVLESDLAELASVTGKSVKSHKNDTGMRASIKGLRKGKPRKVLIEVKLRAGNVASEHEGKSINRLKIALKQAGAKGDAVMDQTVVVWPAADCAADFFNGITAIRDRNSKAISTALKAARTRDKKRPGRWLFQPGVSKTVKRRVCARWVKNWKPFQGKYERTCTRYKTVRRTISTRSNLPKSEAAIFRFTNRFVSSRAIDRQLSVKQNEGWVSQRVATDLRGYLKQAKHPAICTGTPQMIEYFSTKMDAVRIRGKKISDRAEEALTMALEKTRAAHELAKPNPDSAADTGAETLTSQNTTTSAGLNDLTQQIAALTNDTELVAAVQESDTVFDALKVIKKSLKSAAKDLDAATKKAIRRALSAIEAADYLTVVSGHYKALDETILGSMSSIQKAHESSCVCSS